MARGGSTRDLTHDLVVRIQRETDLTVVSHLTCVGSTKDEIKSILDTYFDNHAFYDFSERCELSGIWNLLFQYHFPFYQAA